jgi:acetolactate synthase-1/2/3 large subunit
MGETIEMINKHSKDAIMVSDVGQHQMFTCRYAKFNSSKSNVTSGGLGTMGFALPAAIGAKGMQTGKWLQLSVMVDSK